MKVNADDLCEIGRYTWLATFSNKSYLMVEENIVHARISGPISFQYLDRKKLGYFIPLALWSPAELKSFLCDELSKESLRSVGYLEHAEVETLASEHLSDCADHESNLRALLNLVLWGQQRQGV